MQYNNFTTVWGITKFTYDEHVTELVLRRVNLIIQISLHKLFPNIQMYYVSTIYLYHS
jgi:hypothetical protein